MASPESNKDPPSPSSSEPPYKLFKADGPFGTRMLPPPLVSQDHNKGKVSTSDFGTLNLGLHRPHSISTPDSAHYSGLSAQATEAAKPRSQSYPVNLAQTSSRLYSVSRPSIGHSKHVFELSEEQKLLPPSQPIAQIRQACLPCRKKKVGCDLRQPGNTSDPPCNRCRQENVQCFFAAPSHLTSNSIEDPPSSGSPVLGPNGQALPSLRDLACQHCNLVFLRDDDLRLHLRTQCPEKHYVCTTCHARFKRLNDLDRHCRIHTGERPHKCDICRRTFSRATTLTRHKQGPEGCAGRRADMGRRRLGSFQGPAPDPVPEESFDDLIETDPKGETDASLEATTDSQQEAIEDPADEQSAELSAAS